MPDVPDDELLRLRHIERLAWVAHWGVDAMISSAPVPLPHRLDPLWEYLHAVLDHGEQPDPSRIAELEQLVWAEYEHQRPGPWED